MSILKFFEFISDKKMVKIQYWIKTGRFLNLKNPKRFTEKLQWYKLFYRDPLMTRCVDKYEVRNYIKEIGLERLLIPSLGVWNDAREIAWNQLPDSFVLKTTNGSETNLFVNDKSNLDIEKATEKLNNWLVQTNLNYGREWAYNNVKPRIVCEPIITSQHQYGVGLDDYKFFCFNGKVEYLYVVIDRFSGEGRPQLGIFDRNFKKLPAFRCDERELERDLPKPTNFEELLLIAETLAKPFPHVRVDLYNTDGRILFGEFTFYDGSGYQKYNPDEFDFEMGSKFVLPSKHGTGTELSTRT